MATPVPDEHGGPAGREPAGLSIVIPTLNGARRLPVTLGSIAAQRTGAALQLIVVDDGSADGTRDVAESALRAHGFVTGPASSSPSGATRDVAGPGAVPSRTDGPAAAVVETPRDGHRPTAYRRASVLRHDQPRGRASACNTGIAAASAPVVVILDDDMTLGPGCLEAHRLWHRSHPRGAALGRIRLATPPRETCFSRFLEREQENRERTLLATADDVPFAHCLTGHFSASRELLAEVGGFEGAIRLYGFEDIELAFRLSRHGVRFSYLPEAEAEHRAYMTDFDRMLDRHHEAGVVARQLAERYPEGELRAYLRVDGPAPDAPPGLRPGLRALRFTNRLLLRRAFRRALGSPAGLALLRTAIGASERLSLDRLAHFGYHVARDLRYFQGYYGEAASRR